MKCRYSYFLAFAFLLTLVAESQNTITYQCILRSNAQKDTMCDGKVIPIFGITNTLGAAAKIPAKILYCNEGDSVVLNTKSISQNEHHTIHLHGLDVDTRNDGDPSTSFWLSHLQDTTYSFKAKYAGTYLYHCHVADVSHVQMGMYGMIVVRAAGGVKTAWTNGPSFNKDYKWLMSEVDSVWHFNIPVHDTIADTVHIPKYIPNYFLINGKCGNEINTDDSIKITGAQGEKILMRLANIGYTTNRVIFPSWLNAQIIDTDGRPLPNIILNDTCYLMPGERFSVMLQSNSQQNGFVNVQYLNMNTGAVILTNPVPVTISGFIGLDEKISPSQNVLLFPNPADASFTVKTPFNEGIQHIKVTNLLGQKVMELNMTDNSEEATILISNLASGCYIVQITTGLRIINKKFNKR